MSKVRLFFGVKISMDAMRALEREVRVLRGEAEQAELPVRWLAPATYHVTLKFLGWARSELLEALTDQMVDRLALFRTGTIRLRGLGAFPSAERARVLWAGVEDGSGLLTRLAADLEGAMEPLGFKREKREFHPHVTVARLPELADVTPLVQGRTEQEYSTCSVSAVELFESELSAAGAEYPTRARWPLGDHDQRARV